MALLLAAFAVIGAMLPAPVLAQDGERSINLIDIHFGSPLSDEVEFLSTGGYELSGEGGDGPPPFQSFAPWYRTYWRDLTMEWLLQLDQDNGLLFGFGTGEHGEKYAIDPSLKLGFITQTHPRPNATLSLSVGTTLWGHLSETPCVADYGDLGIFTVNCRLAADPFLSPSETLDYLLDEDPSRLTIRVTYTVDF